MRIKKIFLIALGFSALLLGAIGVFIPVLPTTPFVILAAACFSASSRKINDWLLKSRLFGPYIENYRTKQGISVRRKVASIAFLWTGLLISMIIVRTVWICMVLCTVGVGVTVHLLLIKTKYNMRGDII